MERIEQIWLELSGKLLTFIDSKVNDRALAEDILQEVFIRIHSHLHTLKEGTRLQPWIYQIARNLIIDHYRSRRTATTNWPAEPEWTDEDETAPLLEESLTDMLQMMDELPADQCDALCLTELGGMSQKEYALKAGISYTAARSRVTRARKLLRDRLMNCCHYQFDRYGTIIDITPNTCCCCHPEKNC
jgi:RNA polymerase sigma-70 factor (ECF subfamily)